MSEAAGHTDIPAGLVEAVVALVNTGPVPLGGYTLAEIDAVSGIVHALETEPPPEIVAEAVRSLAARGLITTSVGSDDVEVRGDLGIVLAFEQRSGTVIDARVTGTQADQPWRFLLMPQPEQVTLEVLIDALGIHFYALRKTDDALEQLYDRLPSGDAGPQDADADAVLAASRRTALVSVSHWEIDGTRQTSDIVLAQDDDTYHIFLRDPDVPSQLVAQGLDTDDWRELLTCLSRAR